MEDDAELCLEVQMDPASKKILSRPYKCRSALLDVTVVKPKELDALGSKKTNTLRADEVRKLLFTMERERRKKQRVVDKLKDDDTIIQIRKHEDDYNSHHKRKMFSKHRERITPKSPVDDLERKDFIGIAEPIEPLFCEIRKSLKNVETKISNMQDINLVIRQTTFDESESEYKYKKHRSPTCLAANAIKNHFIYRAETFPTDLKSVLCTDKQRMLERGEKIEGKCVCENCGVVGLLMECQKHPLLNELTESLPPSNHSHLANRKRKPRNNPFGNIQRQNHAEFENWKTKNNNDSIHITELTNRVKLLEEKLAAQEEKLVPKDYFKKIITKMVNNLSPKVFKSKSDTSVHYSEKGVKKKTNVDRSTKPFPRSQKNDQSNTINTQTFTCCNTNTTYDKSNKNNKSKVVTKPLKNKSTATNDEVINSDTIWKWGEEVLKPGIDLKDRVVDLLNEIISKVTINDRASVETPKKADKCDSEMFRKFMKKMTASVYSAYIDPSPKFLNPDHDSRNISHFEEFQAALLSEFSKKNREHAEKMKSRQPSKRTSSKDVDIAYVNPKLALWRTESLDQCKTERVGAQEKEIMLGKQEFLKTMSKAKQYQKDLLWKNIWNQARANGQTRNDKIIIKIPCPNKIGRGQRLYETEISIGEVEEILKGRYLP